MLGAWPHVSQILPVSQLPVELATAALRIPFPIGFVVVFPFQAVIVSTSIAQARFVSFSPFLVVAGVLVLDDAFSPSRSFAFRIQSPVVSQAPVASDVTVTVVFVFRSISFFVFQVQVVLFSLFQSVFVFQSRIAAVILSDVQSIVASVFPAPILSLF
jgi:hypothetical protein